MENKLAIRQVRLADSALIFHSSLARPDYKTIRRLRQFLQKLQHLCSRQVWLLLEQSADKEEPLALFALQQLDLERRRCRLHLYCSSGPADPALLAKISSFCFAREDIFRLELELEADNELKIAAFLTAGWQKESSLQAVFYREQTGLYEDRLLLRLLRPETKDRLVAFYLFKKAVLALVAEPEALLYTRFMRFGQQTNDSFLQGAAQLLGLLNEKGQLLSRTILRKKLGQAKAFYNQPSSLLAEASQQLTAYFAGSAEGFSLPLQPQRGSVFQKKVWQALACLPYGQTRTYEEIALATGAEDEQAARQLARAVGAACSANPFPVIWPCHRVIGKNGRLTGFRGGLDIKEYLLGLEIMGLS